MDKPGADQTVAELAMLLSLDSRRKQAVWRVPILKTSALKDQGFAEVVDAIQEHRAYLVESGTWLQRAQRQVRSELQTLVIQAVMKSLSASVTQEEWNTFIEDITRRERDPYTIAQELERRIGLERE
jgi:LAO/AO transport system kinase